MTERQPPGLHSMTEGLTLEAWIVQAAARIGGESARLDAECLLSHALGKSRTWLKTWPDYRLEQALLPKLEDWLQRRVRGEPVAYIVGVREFWDITLKTAPCTLIPRPDTETLVEAAIVFLKSRASEKTAHTQTLRALDLGTGTGAIAIAVARSVADCQFVATDFDSAILELAEQNARDNAVTNIEFLCSDWFAEIPMVPEFDLIVSNPPYIDTQDPHLKLGDLRFEPQTALVAGEQGLAAIRTIVEGAGARLCAGGALMIEHGYEQGASVREMLGEHGFSQVETRKDLGGQERVTCGLWEMSS